jgi:hypothetical protein
MQANIKSKMTDFQANYYDNDDVSPLTSNDSMDNYVPLPKVLELTENSVTTATITV